MSVTIRSAREDDIAAMSRVLIASITELCIADHGNNPATIAAWTANKSESGLRQMMGSTALYVADRDGLVVGVGALNDDTITLNYVDPAHRRTGVSRAILQALEAIMVAQGVTLARLKSTVTAREFYLSQGWIDDEPVPKGRFVAAYPMVKTLAG